MAIWSAHNRVATVLSRTLCGKCFGNGYLIPTEEEKDSMVCGAGICPTCKGSGFDRNSAEVLEQVRKALSYE